MKRFFFFLVSLARHHVCFDVRNMQEQVRAERTSLPALKPSSANNSPALTAHQSHNSQVITQHVCDMWTPLLVLGLLGIGFWDSGGHRNYSVTRSESLSFALLFLLHHYLHYHVFLRLRVSRAQTITFVSGGSQVRALTS